MNDYARTSFIPALAYFQGGPITNDAMRTLHITPMTVFVSQPFHDIPEETIMGNMDTVGRTLTTTSMDQNCICTEDPVLIYDVYHMPNLGSAGKNLARALEVIDISDLVVFADDWTTRGSCMVEYKYACVLDKMILYLRNGHLTPYRASFKNYPQNLQTL